MEKIIYKLTNDKVYKETLDNGLTIYMYPSNTNNFNITYTIKAGSLITKFKYSNKDKWTSVQIGTAHFLEHMIFKDKDSESVYSYFDKLGSYINAYTTYGNTTFDVIGNRNYKDNLVKLLSIINNPVFNDKDIEKEKPIIKEEISMYENTPSAILNFGLEYNLNINDNHKYMISGKVEDIKKINKKHLYDFYDAFYTPSNSFIVITGNFNVIETICIIKDYFKDKELKDNKVNIFIPNEPVCAQKDYEETNTLVKYKTFKIGLKIDKKRFNKIDSNMLDIYLESILETKYSNASELTNYLKTNNLINNDIYYSYDIRDKYIYISFEIYSDYIDEIINILEESINNLKISDKELSIIKKVNTARYIRSFEDILLINDNITSEVLSNNNILYNKIDLINKMNVKDINYICDNLNMKHKSIYVIN